MLLPVVLLVGRLLVAGLLLGGLVVPALLLPVGALAVRGLPVRRLTLRRAALRGLPVGRLGLALGRVSRLALLSALLLAVRGSLRVLPVRPVRRLVLPVGFIRHVRWLSGCCCPVGGWTASVRMMNDSASGFPIFTSLGFSRSRALPIA